MQTTPLRLILAPERGFYALVVIYGVVIGILTLSIPISVQLLISTVANTAQAEPVLILAGALFALLAFSALFYALQEFALELFERRFFARVTSEIVMRLIYARYAELEQRNREEMVNRYFDIMTVQKTLPVLLTGGVSLILQSGVGFLITSSYHPLFLLFNLVVIALATAIWLVMHRGARDSAVAVSQAKYDMASWLEQLARTNSLFKSDRTIDFALGRSEAFTRQYIDERRRHFYFTFGQLLGFLTLYALSSAALLGLGGALVIQGQLTLGQLVAAELILSAIFVGLTRLGYYLHSYYQLRAAAKKISVFFDLALEQGAGEMAAACADSELIFRDVRSSYLGIDVALNLEIPSGAKVLVGSTTTSLSKHLADLLRRFREPEGGSIKIGGVEAADIDLHRLRDEMVVIDDSLVVGCSIAEYLSLARPGASRGQMREVLAQVGVAEAVESLEDGLDHVLTPYGYPLSVSETMRLKLGYALLFEPRVIVLSHLFDVVGHEWRQSIFESIRERSELTLVYFSNRRDVDCFDRFLFFSPTEQRYVANLAALDQAEADSWVAAANAREGEKR